MLEDVDKYSLRRNINNSGMSQSERTVAYSHSNPQSPAHGPIVDVWAHNFLSEIRKLSLLLSQFPIVSFVSEFVDTVSAQRRRLKRQMLILG